MKNKTKDDHKNKTKEQLIKELKFLKKRIDEQKQIEIAYKKAKEEKELQQQQQADQAS